MQKRTFLLPFALVLGGVGFIVLSLSHGQDRTVAPPAILTLLLETATDAQDPHVRYTTLSPLLINRLAAAGLLILAINELPSPGEDLLEQSEQLCAFIRAQQGTDGALGSGDRGT